MLYGSPTSSFNFTTTFPQPLDVVTTFTSSINNIALSSSSSEVNVVVGVNTSILGWMNMSEATTTNTCPHQQLVSTSNSSHRHQPHHIVARAQVNISRGVSAGSVFFSQLSSTWYGVQVSTINSTTTKTMLDGGGGDTGSCYYFEDASDLDGFIGTTRRADL